MFSENDRISQRQMERQIVLVLLCPAFWQLAAYGASDGLPGMAGIFVGYGLLAVWCIYLVRLGGLYCRLESVMGRVSDSRCTAGALRTVSARGGRVWCRQ